MIDDSDEFADSLIAKDVLAAVFRRRLQDLMRSEGQSVAAFLRATGIDRSALSQFLDDRNARLPRAETLRRIAEARNVSIDWLLGLENAPEGRQVVTPSVQIESSQGEDGSTPLERWRAEAAGYTLRYVPSTLPDMLSLTQSDAVSRHAEVSRAAGTEPVLEGIALGETAVEICMPRQTVDDLAAGTGLWRRLPPAQRRQQLDYMVSICAAAYPSLRLHLYDGVQTYSAPFTVFGQLRAAVYIGDAYLVITASEQVHTFIRRFNELVRAAVVGPDRVHQYIEALALKIPS